MKSFLKFLGIIAIVAVMIVVIGCATTSSVDGTTDPHGFLTSAGKVAEVVGGGTEVASYSVILGLFDSGYADYATAVKTAEAGGKQITTVTKFLLFLTKTTAYAK